MAEQEIIWGFDLNRIALAFFALGFDTEIFPGLFVTFEFDRIPIHGIGAGGLPVRDTIDVEKIKSAIRRKAKTSGHILYTGEPVGTIHHLCLHREIV